MRRLVPIWLMLLISVAPGARAGEHVLTPMLGFTGWADETGHTARATAVDFDDGTEFTLGFRYHYVFDNGLAVGVDVYSYGKDVIPSSASDTTSVFHSHALLEYFFNHTGSVSPFVGGGFGFAAVSFDDGTLGDESAAGGAFEFNAGVLFRVSDAVGVQIEYKASAFDIDEDIDALRTDIDTTSHSLLFGVTIHL